MKTTFKYYLPDYGQSVDDAVEITASAELNNNEIAEACAADAWMRGRWENPTPFVLMALYLDGTEIGLFEIDIEIQPSFCVRRLNIKGEKK